MQNKDLIKTWLGPELLSNPEEVIAETEREVAQFYENLESVEVNEEQKQRWQAWLASEEGSRVYNELGDRLLESFSYIKNVSDPLHDRRHMLMVDAAALRLIIEDEITEYDFRRVFLVSAIAHDFGRVIETKLCQQLPGTQLPTHGYFSYVVLTKITEGLAIPEDLLTQIYYSVAGHTGNGDKHDLDDYIGQATQRADREQLVNLELVGKTLVGEVVARGLSPVLHTQEIYKFAMIKGGRISGNDWWQHVGMYERVITFEVGADKENLQKFFQTQAIILFLLVLDDMEQTVFFAPELKINETKQDLPREMAVKQPFLTELFDQAKRKVDSEEFEIELNNFKAGRSLQELTRELLTPPEMMMNEELINKVWQVLDKFDEVKQQRLANGFTWILKCREEERKKLKKVAGEIKEKFTEENLEYKIANLVISTVVS